MFAATTPSAIPPKTPPYLQPNLCESSLRPRELAKVREQEATSLVEAKDEESTTAF